MRRRGRRGRVVVERVGMLLLARLLLVEWIVVIVWIWLLLRWFIRVVEVGLRRVVPAWTTVYISWTVAVPVMASLSLISLYMQPVSVWQLIMIALTHLLWISGHLQSQSRLQEENARKKRKKVTVTATAVSRLAVMGVGRGQPRGTAKHRNDGQRPTANSFLLHNPDAKYSATPQAPNPELSG
ncbi:hypothetical protein FA15DRAFT_53926 [Coprinopsis marcescibilis]|uniref:Uncharacterized protein n=1 Tax=Coprinopsis marcescibilis TaxID=230819 RepID=A0A5C3L1C7_COPMA|nr:hypothetical protein FA15DRAFT_53926 [Coprinopsis marcescibilis]